MRYALDVSNVGSYGDPRRLAELALEAEQAGWDGFFLWDVAFGPEPQQDPVTDPWVTLAAVATVTTRIKLGAMVTPLARRLPWEVARQTVALDQLSHGRLILGVGLGFQARDFEAFGQDPDPVVRAEELDESLAVITGLWTGEPCSFAGRHYRLDSATFLPRPLQSPRIPIWVASYWPHRRPLRRAARWDGLVPGKVNDDELTLDELRSMAAYIRERRPSEQPFDVAVYGRTPADPRRAAAVTRPWADAGATWWRENIEDERGPLSEMLARVRGGPPHG